MTFKKTAKRFGEMRAENGFAKPAARPLTRIHRSPTKAIRSKTPAEMWNGEKPKVDHFLTSGSQASSRIPEQNRTKLHPIGRTGQRCKMLGYAPCSGNRLCNPSTRNQFVARDVWKKSEDEDPMTRTVVPLTIPETQEKEGEITQAVGEVNPDEQPAQAEAIAEMCPLELRDGFDDHHEEEDQDTEDILSEDSTGEPSDTESGASALPPQLKRSNFQNETAPRTSGRECRKSGGLKDFITSYGSFSAADHPSQVNETFYPYDEMEHDTNSLGHRKYQRNKKQSNGREDFVPERQIGREDTTLKGALQ